MQQRLAYTALILRDYDEAVLYYTGKLHFTLVEDTVLSTSKRWVVIAPPGNTNGSGLLLAKADSPIQESCIGNQSGGRVYLFLHTDDFERDYQNLINNQIKIIRQPSNESYGKVAVFEDLYGNLWDLIEPSR